MRKGEKIRLRGYLIGQYQANKVVRQLINEGSINPASHYKCTDCDKQAAEYDHRDYNLPAVIEPVCRGCNTKRGAAIYLYPPGEPPHKRIYSASKLPMFFGSTKDIAIAFNVSVSCIHSWIRDGFTKCRADQAIRLTNNHFEMEQHLPPYYKKRYEKKCKLIIKMKKNKKWPRSIGENRGQSLATTSSNEITGT